MAVVCNPIDVEDVHLVADLQTVSDFVEKVKAAGGTADLFVYPGEGHAFMNAGDDIIKRMKSKSGISQGLTFMPDMHKVLKETLVRSGVCLMLTCQYLVPLQLADCPLERRSHKMQHGKE